MIRCLAVDDEPLALDLLEDNIRQVPFLQLSARCRNAFEAMDILQREKIDLIFLDINMPGLFGTDFIASLPYRPQVIFITAYKQYAHSSYDLDALDYLVKPVPFERFLKAANKARDFFRLRNTDSTAVKNDYIFINSEYSLVKIRFDELLYIEGLKDYIKIYMLNQMHPLLTRMSMKSIEELLPAGNFIRVHKSFIVSMDKVNSIRKNRIRIGASEIPISTHYRENLSHILSKVSEENPSEEKSES